VKASREFGCVLATPWQGSGTLPQLCQAIFEIKTEVKTVEPTGIEPGDL
jgi:hypothetical protein